jgi:hypothetical protein
MFYDDLAQIVNSVDEYGIGKRHNGSNELSNEMKRFSTI